MKETFIVKAAWKSVFDNLSDQQAGVLIKAVFDYMASGEMPAWLTDGELRMALRFMAIDFDAFERSYEEKCARLRENGRKGADFGRLGGRPRKTEETPKNPERGFENPKNPKKPQMGLKNPLNDNDSDNDLEIPPLIPPLEGVESDKDRFSIPEKFVLVWDRFGGKRKSIQDDYQDFCEKTEGLVVDYEKLAFFASREKKRYFQSWLNQLLTQTSERCFPVSDSLPHDVEDDVAPPPDDPPEDFGRFWDAYGKKRGRAETLAYWLRMSCRDRAAALEGVAAYVEANPDPVYRKDPVRYLRRRAWEDENYLKPEYPPKTERNEPATEYLPGIDRYF